MGAFAENGSIEVGCTIEVLKGKLAGKRGQVKEILGGGWLLVGVNGGEDAKGVNGGEDAKVRSGVNWAKIILHDDDDYSFILVEMATTIAHEAEEVVVNTWKP
jgi:hypothetical protein